MFANAADQDVRILLAFRLTLLRAPLLDVVARCRVLMSPCPDLFDKFCTLIPAPERRSILNKVETLVHSDFSYSVPIQYAAHHTYFDEIKVCSGTRRHRVPVH